MILKIGSKGDVVKQIQKELNLDIIDGVFGPKTQNAVVEFQKQNNLKETGEVSLELLNLILSTEFSTDLIETTESDILYRKYWLNADEYSKSKTQKYYIYLHHTAGSHNPYNTIDIWERDNRGAIATEFVIGGTSLKGDETHNGEVLQAFPGEHWAYHLGGVVDRFMHYHSVGIELCNYGPLKERKGEFYTIYGQKVEPKYVTDLGFKFRGSKYYHSYTDEQIEACKNLLYFISERNGIDITKGLPKFLKNMSTLESFEYDENVVRGKVLGVLSHTNVRKDKSDVYPHPKLVEMLKSL